MSKMGQDFLELQEAAYTMTREEFLARYGLELVYVWDQTHQPEQDQQ